MDYLKEYTLKKSTIINDIIQTTKLPKKDVVTVVDTMLDLITESLKEGESVSLSGFGSFLLVERKPKELYLPGSNEKVYVKAKRAVRFRPSKKLKEAIE